ncbi:MAG: acyloxyacyl hydrolase [Alphaproteobacteria bacterium]|nr:acyloxyacyl hydrolase [Alphaproteobacteria bacterium]
MKKTLTLFAGSLAALASLPAQAQLIDEVRFGIAQHNICVLDCDNADKEDGPNITGELVFDSPDFLGIILSPRPYVTGSVNTAGNTSYGGVGLLWNWDFSEGWSFEPSLGYVIHDGALGSPYPQGSPEGDAFSQVHVLLGSEDLFRTGLALNRDFGERWGLQLQYDHLSHGQILGNGRNQGLDNIGLRVYYRFAN